MFLWLLICGLSLRIAAALSNTTEEGLIDQYESQKWVLNYDDVRLVVGQLWEPSVSSISEHHNYTLMTQFLKRLAEEYPHLAYLNSIGKSVEGRELWVLTIARQPRFHLPGRPEFKYVANMHGNEVLGRELLLQLAEVLLRNYGTNDFVTRLLDTTRIHLLPSMNPDGYEKSQEGDEMGTRGRENANGVDLNRNFPAQDDYRAHYHSRVTQIQPEAQYVMEWSRSIPFVLSANLHSGTALVNYPFDDGFGARARTGDNELFVYLAYSYARAHRRMFRKGHRCTIERLNDPTDPHLGIVNGASWYEVTGGMQDWSYVFGRSFEVTVEMNCVKFPRAKELAGFWQEHKFALLHYIDMAHYTIRGFVTDEQTNVGVQNVSVEIGPKQQKVKSYRHGDYWRPALPGVYNVTFRHPSYFPLTVEVTVSSQTHFCELNVTLRPHSFQAEYSPPISTVNYSSSRSIHSLALVSLVVSHLIDRIN